MAELAPTPETVVGTLEQMTGPRYPRTSDDLQQWFRVLGLAPADVRAVTHPGAHIPGSSSWVAMLPAWGEATRIGWSFYRDEFAGLHWFLWTGADWDAVLAGANELATGFAAAFGEPVERLEQADAAWTALWSSGPYTIDMYVHTGSNPVGAAPIPCVQLHLSITETAAALEQAALETLRRRRENGSADDHSGDEV